MKSVFYFLLCISLVTGIHAQTVTTEFGQIQGSMNGSVYQFLGIPFAKPPVDSLRWRAPQNPDAWPGILNTTSFPPVCPQKSFDQGGTNDTIIGNEDCLYLNVWTPQISAQNLPVLVFIHGGGNQQGSTSEVNGGAQMYFGKNLAERGNAVLVTIQYRLGPLGFLVHPGLEPENANGTSGNYAVLDQVLALTWIQNNISNFGGDPNKVLVFGESAGGLNVGNLLTTPLANGLFQRAAIESAVPIISEYSTARDKGLSYVDSFTVVGTDVQKINYMRALPGDSLVKYETPPISGGAVGMKWQAVLDDLVFFDFPLERIQSGNFNAVPLLIGSNSEEMSLSAPATVFPAMVTALRNSIFPVPQQAQAALLYPSGANTTEARASYIQLLTDAQFTSTTRRVAQCVSQNQNDPVYRYFFTHKHAIPALAALGSYHGMELFYVFNTWEDATLGTGPLFSAQDDSVQTAMLQYWVNFANTGDPNGSGLEIWPQYQSATDCYLEIKATPDGSNCGLRTAESDLWDAAIGFTGCTSTAGLELPTANMEIQAFPNPSKDYFELTLPDAMDDFRVQVFNTLGQLVYSVNDSNRIDLTPQHTGIFFVELRTTDATYRGQLLKID